MKHVIWSFTLVLLIQSISIDAQSVGINTTGSSPDGSAILDISSTEAGILIPRMTTAQREAIASPAEGLLIFDLNSSSFWYFQNAGWVDLNTVNRPFENVDGVVRKTGSHQSDDFVFGSSSVGASLFSWENGRVLFHKHKRAFRAGSPRDTFDFNVGLVDGEAAGWDPDSLGYYTLAAGFDVVASGDIGSVALGRNLLNTGDNGSFAAGRSNFVSGSNGSAAIGNALTVTGDWGAIAMGDGNVVSGDNGSAAFGYDNQVSGDHGAIALGYENCVFGNDGALALGRHTRASAEGAIVLGVGLSKGNPLLNAQARSLMVGFNSNLPTLFIGAANGLNTIGKVGVGTSLPSVTLDVDGGFQVDGITFNVDPVQNRVGIGTQNPNDALHIDNGNLLISRGFTNSGVKRKITVAGAMNSPGQEYASLEFRNYDQNEYPVETVTAKISSENTDGMGNTDLTFYTFQVPGLLARMTISDLGDVGIGTTDPSEKLQVSGGDLRIDRGTTSSGLTRHLIINGARNGSGNPFASIDFHNYDDNSGMTEYIAAQVSSENNSGDDSGDMRFSTRDGILTERMIITNQGSVGINTSVPSERLHVDGGNVLLGRAGVQSGLTRTLRLDGARSGGGTYYAAVQFSNYDENTSPTDLVRAMISSTNPNGVGNGDLRFHTYNGTLNEVMRIEGNGNIGIGNIDPTHPLELSSGAHVTAAGVWTNASDASKKYDVQELDHGLDEVMNMRPVRYKYRTDGSVSIGFLAQEMEDVVPEVVSGDAGNKGIAYGLLVSTLVQAMQEQQLQLQTQAKLIEAQQQAIDQLQKLVNALIQKVGERTDEID